MLRFPCQPFRVFFLPLVGLLTVCPVGTGEAGEPLPLSPLFQASRVIRVNHLHRVGLDQRNPVVFMASGDLWVVWQRHTPEPSEPRRGFEIVARRFSSGQEPKGEEIRLETLPAISSRRPAVAGSSGGRRLIVWESLVEERRWEIRARAFEGTAALGPEVRVSTEWATQAVHPAAASLSDGGYVAVWESVDQDGSGRGVFGRVLGSDGELGEERSITQQTLHDQSEPRVVAGPKGGFLVAWSGFGADSEDREDVFVRRFEAGGLPAASEIHLAEDRTGRQGAPELIATSDGGYLAFWESRGGIAGRVLGVSGKPVGGELWWVPPSGLEAGSPRAVDLGARRVLVVWESQVTPGAQKRRIRGQLFQVDRPARTDGEIALLPITRPFWISPETSGFSRWPELALDPQNDVQVVWNAVPDIHLRRLTLGELSSAPHRERAVDCWESRLRELVLAVGPSSQESLHAWPLETGRARLLGGDRPSAPIELAPCPGSLTEEDRTAFELLSDRVQISGRLEGQEASPAQVTHVTLYRDRQIGTFRLDVYPFSKEGESLGRLALRAELPLIEEELAQGIRLERLPLCSPDDQRGCSQTAVPLEPTLQPP